MGVTTNGLRPGNLLMITGVIITAVLAVVFSGKVASVSAGVALLALTAVRIFAREPLAISARSTRFDAGLLAVLGVGILVLALTADNI